MPDFSTEAYKSYVSLCRELRLERDWQDHDLASNLHGHVVSLEMVYERQTKPIKEYGLVWLPQLADWLELIERSGYLQVDIGGPEKLPVNVPGDQGYVISAYQDGGDAVRAWAGLDSEQYPEEYGQTREEAAARLAIAVGAVKVPVT